MPWPFLLQTGHQINDFNKSTNIIQTSTEIHSNKEEENDENDCHELTISEHHPLLTSLNQICIYWRQLIFDKLRSLLNLIVVTMINLTTRLTCFMRQTAPIQSTTPLTSLRDASSIRTFQEDLVQSSASVLNLNSLNDLPVLETSPMAHMLIQQQTPNINIHQTTSTQDETLLPTTHSLDEKLFFRPSDSASFLQFLQRFASESQVAKCPLTTNNFLNKTLPQPKISLPLVKSEGEEEQINSLNCDKIQAVNCENVQPNELDHLSTDITPMTTNNLLDEDILVNTERLTRRRRRRSSSTKTSSSNEQIELIKTDAIEQIDDNNNLTNTEEKKVEESHEKLPLVSIENLSLDENNGEKEESHDKTTPPNRLRGRRLKFRSQRQIPSTADETIELILPLELTNVTPPSSPNAPPASSPSSSTNSHSLTGSLKRSSPTGTTKKVVRFADSVGRELAQVQYIQSLMDDMDDSDDFFFGKNTIYVPKISNIEHKPWSFDVDITSKHLLSSPIPRRFFCLYRQPNSEHPDVYLHEIWKSQIKLEHADIRLKSSSTGEQYLYGTLWVTNASYNKYVSVKYTFNRWLNTYEHEAQHRCHSNDFRNIDQFEFSIDIPYDVDRIDFVLHYCVNGQEYWDNNNGNNYTLETETASVKPTTISLPHDCDFNEMRFY